MNNIRKKDVITLLILILLFVGTYILLSNLTKKDEELVVQNYEVNEYIPVYISEDEMAKIYLNDFITKVYVNIDEAYEFLNEEYRTKRFGSSKNFLEYMKTLSLSFNVDKYAKSSKGGYTIFKIYDKNGNFYIFKIKGVMQYSVYLDDKTVEI